MTTKREWDIREDNTGRIWSTTRAFAMAVGREDKLCVALCLSPHLTRPTRRMSCVSVTLTSHGSASTQNATKLPVSTTHIAYIYFLLIVPYPAVCISC